jgi:pentatricopeptide repeat protein
MPDPDQTQNHLAAGVPVRADLTTDHSGPDPAASVGVSASASPPRLNAGRYQILGEIARGGIGIVYRAHDPAVNRDVAVKVLQERFRKHAVATGRFVQEGRITGQLQHPGIPAVHEIGILPDGSPYMAMKLVKGATLADQLAGPSPDRGQLVAIFLQVAQAVGYAHSRGVIHRDLKPANVMVGQFGEVQVMDWGLAKVLSRAAPPSGPRESPTLARTTLIETGLSSEPDTETLAGSMLGTPAYMPPEQAAGEVERVDERADVFGLGAVLCTILTGDPPFRDKTAEAIRLRAVGGQVDDAYARLDGCGADPELLGLCKRCLAPDRDSRPRNAGEVGAAVSAHLAAVEDRLRRAERERAAAEVKAAEQRKRRRWQAAAAGLLVVATVLSGWQAIRATRAEEKARAERDKAVAAGEQAQRAAAEAKAVLGFLLNDVLSAARPKGMGGGLGKDVTVRQAIDAAEPKILTAFPDQPPIEASVRLVLGTTYNYLGELPTAIGQLERALELRKAELGPDAPDTLRAQIMLGVTYRAAGQWQKAIPLYEQALAVQQATLGPDHPDTLFTLNSLGMACRTAGKTDRAIRLFEQTLAGRTAKLGPDHPDTLYTQNSLAQVCKDAGLLDRAIELHQRTLTAQRKAIGPEHSDTLVTQNSLAMDYREAGQLHEAIALHKQTLEAQLKTLPQDHPNTLYTLHTLAMAYCDAGRFDEAIRLFEQTLAARKAKLGPDHPETLVTQSSLGAAYQDAGQLERAIALHNQTLAAQQATLGADHPDVLITLNHLARASDQAGEGASAEARFGDVLKRRRASLGPEHPDVAATLFDLGENLVRRSKSSDAEPLLRECLAIYEKKLPQHWRRFEVQNLLGASLLAQGKYADAEPQLIASYTELKARERALAPRSKSRLAEAGDRLVRLYEAWDKPEKARMWRAKLER